MSEVSIRAVVAPLLFLSVAVMLALSGWVRPPLSPDIEPIHLSIGLWGGGAPADTLLQGARSVPADSAGIVLLSVLAGAVFVAVLRPRKFYLAAGVLLAVSVGLNAAAVLNHPALMEQLEREREQRQTIVQVLRYSPTGAPLSTATNGRFPVDEDTPPSNRAWDDVTRPWDYLLYGVWLIVWAALGLWFAAPGRLARRVAHVARWTTVGALLALTICLPRLRAEYAWLSAVEDEREGDYAAAREHLRSAVNRFQVLSELQRTWRLQGKLDYLESRSTLAEAIFRASQLSAIASVSPNDQTRVEESTNRLARAAGLLYPAAAYESHAATAAARRQLADILTAGGVASYLQAPRYTDDGLDYSRQQQRLAAAHDAWQHALALEPSRLDGRIYLSYTHRFVDRERPQAAQPIVRIGDRLLQADVLNMLGDAYFEAGLIEEARRFYAQSLDLLNLPQQKNLRAQKGLGGL